MSAGTPETDPHPLSRYVSWAWVRNRDPILDVFKSFFPASGDVLELGSGGGAHIAYFAPHFPGLRFQPSDRDSSFFGAVDANRSAAGLSNIALPVIVDLTKAETWPRAEDRLYDVIFAINVFHVAPRAAIDDAAEVAAAALKPGGRLAIYGPFKVEGRHTSASNEAFDASIRAQNPAWGLRDVRNLEKAAGQRGVILQARHDMPANNLLLVFEKTPA
jgi:SAM-dependent methyltransferase